MCDISMMYLPSLYFWLVSKACSWWRGSSKCGTKDSPLQALLPPALPLSPKSPALPSGPRKDLTWGHWGLEGCGGWPPPPQLLTYFQPSVVLQLSQKISATEWSPVSRRRCSAGPQPTLTLSQEAGRTEHPVGMLSVHPPGSPKWTSTWRGLNLPSWKPLPSAIHPLITSAWAFPPTW